MVGLNAQDNVRDYTHVHVVNLAWVEHTTGCGGPLHTID
jgi:hypothetical protein